MSNDPYAALGLTKTATADEIKKAYRKLARASHPDLHPDDPTAEARFKTVSAAYDLLKDPETRARFDNGEIDATGAERQERKFYRDYAEAPGNAYRSRRGYEDFGDASDIFAEILRQRTRGGAGGHDPRAQGFSIPGPDMRYALEVEFVEAVTGAKKRITLPDGETLDVQIPQGTANGQTIRLRGKGGPGYGGGPQGDALVMISVRSHPVFRRDGDDIVITLPISIDEAVLGAKVKTPTIDGTVNLTIPRGASSGQVLRLRGRGVKPAGGQPRGDQCVELRIIAPPKIDEALQVFMEDWRKTNAYDPRKGMTS